MSSVCVCVVPGMYWSSVHRWSGCRRADAAAQDCLCRCERVPGWWCVYWQKKRNVTKTFLFPAGCENNHVEEVIMYQYATVTACFCCHQEEIKKQYNWSLPTDQNFTYVHFLSEFSFSSSLVSVIISEKCVFLLKHWLHKTLFKHLKTFTAKTYKNNSSPADLWCFITEQKRHLSSLN